MRTLESERERALARRRRLAESEGRVLRYRAPTGQGMTREQRILKRREDRAIQAIKDGRKFFPRKACDAHVRAFRAYMKRVEKKVPELVGPPKPSKGLLGEAGYRRWRYWNVNGQREKEIEKRNRYVKEVSVAYARERIGLSVAPQPLIEAKRYYLLIKRQLKEMTNELD